MSKTERALEEAGPLTASEELTDELDDRVDPPGDDQIDHQIEDRLRGHGHGDAATSSLPAPSPTELVPPVEPGDPAASGDPAMSSFPAPDPHSLGGSGGNGNGDGGDGDGGNGHHGVATVDAADPADEVVESPTAFDAPLSPITDDAVDEAIESPAALDAPLSPSSDTAPATELPAAFEAPSVPSQATEVESTDGRTTAVPGEALRISPGTEILEELRRADIDGPTVDLAPQDDTSTGVRRPQRLADYDPAPIPIPAKPPRLLGRKPRVRKVTRVVRHVDPWSVFKIAIIANLVLYVVVLTSGVLLWNVANATGTVDNVERFFESFGWTEFEFNGGQIYHSAWIAGLFLVIGLTGLAVLAATLFNLITDLVGGVRLTVLEEEVVEKRTSPMRRFVVRRPEPEVPAVDRDESGQIIREAVVDDSGAIIRRSR